MDDCPPQTATASAGRHIFDTSGCSGDTGGAIWNPPPQQVTQLTMQPDRTYADQNGYRWNYSDTAIGDDGAQGQWLEQIADVTSGGTTWTAVIIGAGFDSFYLLNSTGGPRNPTAYKSYPRKGNDRYLYFNVDHF